MKRAILAIFCCAFLAAAPGAKASPASDQDMASRYLRSAQSGDDESQFYLGALYSAGIGVPRSDAEAFRYRDERLTYGDWVAKVTDQASKDGVTGTPTVKVNGQLVQDWSKAGFDDALSTAQGG